MVRSAAQTPEAYLAELPDERRQVVTQLRKLIQQHIPDGYVESVNWGMLTWEVPLERYPNTYNGQPLGYVSLAAQKNGYSLYLLGPYGDPQQLEALKAGFARAGKKLDMGKSCVRFRKPEDLDLETLGKVIASTPPDRFIAQHEAGRSGK